MNIKVYGTGCPKCQQLMANVETALKIRLFCKIGHVHSGLRHGVAA